MGNYTTNGPPGDITLWPLAEIGWGGVSDREPNTPEQDTNNNGVLVQVSRTTNDCMAVGNEINVQSTDADPVPLAIQQTPEGWTSTFSPAGNGQGDVLNGVSCTADTWCMAVGGVGLGSDFPGLTTIWNGSTWSIVSNLTSDGSTFDAVSCVSSTYCVGVGQTHLGGPLSEVYSG